MFRIVKVVAIGSMLICSAAFADDDWGGYQAYGQNDGYAPVVQEQFIASPQGVVEEEIVYVPERVVEYQPVTPRYAASVSNYYGYAQPMPSYGRGDWDDRW
jgi:hypothetical protein